MTQNLDNIIANLCDDMQKLIDKKLSKIVLDIMSQHYPNGLHYNEIKNVVTVKIYDHQEYEVYHKDELFATFTTLVK